MNSIFSESTEFLGKKTWPLLLRKPKKETSKEKGNRIAREIFEQW